MVNVNKNLNTIGNNDPLDINELALLNEDISPELIEKLQMQISQDTQILNDSAQDLNDTNDDAALFEEVETAPQAEVKQETNKKQASENINNINNSIDDNFIKKYKAKLEKQKKPQGTDVKDTDVQTDVNKIDETSNLNNESRMIVQSDEQLQEQQIEKVSGGNIIERPLSQEHTAYAEELGALDDNINYSKYVIYISPENKEFIDGLTVKERKNLINKIIKEQGDITINKRKYRTVKNIMLHALIAIITVAITIPVTYSIINTALEISIDNYRRSQGNFQVLYREKGKIKNILR